MKIIQLKNIIVVISLLLSLTAVGQNKEEGTWYFHPIYTNTPKKVIETDKEIVYYLSGGNLFSYDKRADENNSYTVNNRLNDSDITDIYYNYDRHYLLVCYSSSNIDLLYDNGETKNLSDIKYSSLNSSLTINGVAFDGDYIYVATDFGIVKFNEKRGEVVTSGIYNKKVSAVTVMNDNLVIHLNDSFYYTNKNNYLNSFEKFTKLYKYGAPVEIWTVADDKIFLYSDDSNNLLSCHTIDFDSKILTENKLISTVHTKLPTYVIHGAEGAVYYQADDNLYTVNENYSEELLCNLPEELIDTQIGTYNGLSSIWSINKRGLGNYSIDSSGGLTVMMDRFLPDAFSVNKVRYFFPSYVNTRLYAQNNGSTAYRFGESGSGYEYTQTAAYVDMATDEYKDITVYPVELKSPKGKDLQAQQKHFYAISPTGLAENPKDPSEYFLATATDGVYKVKDGKLVGRYGIETRINDAGEEEEFENSPMILRDKRYIAFGISMDRSGNLWVITSHANYKVSPLMILPADKVKLHPSEVKKEDWIHPDMSEIAFWGGQDVHIYHCKKDSNITFITQSNSELFVYDNNHTPYDFTDDKMRLWEEMYDQDQKKIDPQFFTAICEDADGKVWLGCYQGGVVMISQPSKALNPTYKFTRVKMPRNDGSNLADYLLSADQIMDISVDMANRKWIATYGSGLFLVSPSGDEIIENFTTENSILPTDKLNCVYADPASPTIYVGTDYGLLSYTSDATPVGDDYSDVLAYPNPVKPEYRGDVTIKGLMENTLVKITDASGSLVFQGKSDGGRFIWDVCNASGSRVPSGVYYVFLSSGGGNTGYDSTAAVTKIMVIN